LIPFVKKQASLAGDAVLALIYWTRSAEQKNVDSMVKMGDYYLLGLGTTQDEEKAAQCYQAAADTMQSAQANWNLGWMHENGIGIDQDFHLAKRHYDLALETNPREAYLPVVLALYKLRLRSWWNTITNGKIKSIQEEPGKFTTCSNSIIHCRLVYIMLSSIQQSNKKTSPSQNGSPPSSKPNSPAGTTTMTTQTIKQTTTTTPKTSSIQTFSNRSSFSRLRVHWHYYCMFVHRDNDVRRKNGGGWRSSNAC
jgi:hypothetical protein